MDSGLFGTSMEDHPMGTRRNGRYKMPLLPGERGTKSGGDWVPGNLQSVTNLLDGFEDSRALNVWEQEQLMIGLVMQPSLYERLTVKVKAAKLQGVDTLNINDTEAGKDLRRFMTGARDDYESSILGLAKQAAGANEARDAGTVRHDAWEIKAKTGLFVGTPEMKDSQSALERLLQEHQLVRVPHLQERTVRNVELQVAGRFDDILMHLSTGKLLMADLKTKAKPFRSWSAVDGQLAAYAGAEWMLTEDGLSYEDGPRQYVRQDLGVAMVMPSNGDTPYLRAVDLDHGRRVARLARDVADERAFGASAVRKIWGEDLKNLLAVG